MGRLDPSSIVASAMTVSDKIRALNQSGFRKSEIADLLGKRYQHVRNVLVNDARRAAGPQRPVDVASPKHDASSGVSEAPREYQQPNLPQSAQSLTWVEVGPEGALLLPEQVRNCLEVAEGGQVLIRLNADGSVTLLSVDGALKQAQAIIRSYVPPGVSLVDELLAERRAEAKRENEGG